MLSFGTVHSVVGFIFLYTRYCACDFKFMWGRPVMTYLNTIDGEAIVIVEGCRDKHYEEYDRNANKDDGSCKTKKQGCMEKDYEEYD